MCGAAVTFFLLTTPVQGSERMCHLGDVHWFGVSREICDHNRHTAQRHLSNVVSGLETWQQFTWSSRQDLVITAWTHLGAACDKANNEAVRVKALENLRVTIGDKAYFSGAMPAAIPDYGVWMPVKK